ncbi:MAG: cache domain-containing protein, partial [Actinobacteria bacterium]|nr:cache domain-containing protein [Actinomycetota bacterium]
MTPREILSRLGQRYRYRLVAIVLVVSLPISILLGVVLTRKASTSLTASTSDGAAQVARAVSLHVEDFISERKENLSVLAAEASADLGAPSVSALAERLDKTYGDYDILEVTDLAGHVRAASRAEGTFDPSAMPWFRTVAGGQTVVQSLAATDGDLRWLLAAPVLVAAGTVSGAVVAQLDEAVLAELLNPEVSKDTVIAVDPDHHLVYSTAFGKVDGANLLAKGALRTTIDNEAVRAALAGDAGVARVTQNGRSLVAGYDHIDALGWALVVEQPASVALAPVNNQRRAAVVLVLLASALAIALALVFSRRESRYLRALADSSRSASTEVTSAAAELSASSEELAATTTEQSAAVTEASATTEELARASGSIADTVDEVAAQSAETRDNLEQAEADIVASSERTLALAERV